MNIKDIISTILKNETDARIISAVAAISGSLFEGNSVENVFPLVNPCEAVEEYSEADIAKCKSPILIRNYFKGGAVVAIPDFTRGQWYWRKDLNDSKFKLTR